MKSLPLNASLLLRAAKVRRWIAATLFVLIAGCSGGGDQPDQPPPPTQPNGVTIAEGRGIATASLGDAQQRIFVIPGETTGRSISIVPNDSGALF